MFIPIGHAIQKRRMTNLHHVLMTSKEDPVRLVYEKSLKLPYEANWANDNKSLMVKYGIIQTDDEVTELS